ncbi:MAG: sensor histidine kinase [Candidatus Accumulibacter sp.]|jgi:two-component system sensor histidine kinase TctE|nr:sensor histidine kinase [Accumulibacter sp.]
MRPNRPVRLRSLKSRLAVWVILPSLTIIAVDLAFSFRNSDEIATLVQQRLLHGAAVTISEQLTISDGIYEVSVPPAAFELLGNRFKDRASYAIHTPEGRLVAGDGQLPPRAGDSGPTGEAFFSASLRGEPVRVVAYTHVIPNSPRGETVITQVAQTLRNHDEFRDELLRVTIRRHFYLMAAILLFLAAAFRWMLKPISEFGASLKARAPGSLERLAESDAPSELAPVIHALNDYVERLDHSFKSYGKFVANTAHHLRNSFAVIGAQANFARRSAGADPVQREVLDAVCKTLDKCTRIINQLLMLASLEQPKSAAAPAGKTALAPIVAEVVEELAPLGCQKGIELGVEALDENAAVEAPARLLHELLTNLVGNAILHMRKEGRVSVSLVSSERETALTVTDDGVGIPEALREKVFERFFRIGESNSDGSGLGMAIVKEICDSLGARVALSTPAGGEGLRVDVCFPREPDDGAASGADAVTARRERRSAS